MALRKSADSRPQISHVTPGAAIAGGELQIRGKGFVKSERPHVTIGEVTAPIIIGSDSFIIARVPEGATAGELVIAALRALKRGGTVAVGGIHMSPIPPLDYELLYHERVIRSVANNTRRDGEDFLRIAAEIPIRTEVREFALDEANQALNALKNDAIRGAAVLKIC